LGGIIQRSGACVFYFIGWGSNFYSIKNVSLSADISAGRAVFYNQNKIIYSYSNISKPSSNTSLFDLNNKLNHFIARIGVSSQFQVRQKLFFIIKFDVLYIYRNQDGTPIEMPTFNSFLAQNSFGVTYKF
jgi:hypothetical protein